MLLPALVGGLALYFALDLYLLQLQHYLAHPSERIASLVLGVATAGLLLTVFMHSVTITTITSAALGREDKGWKYFCVSRRAWRVYAAHLRFLVVCAALTSVIVIARQVADRAKWTGVTDSLALVAIATGLVYLRIRIGFLLAPIGCAEDYGPVVREAWRRSYHFLALISVLVILFLAVGFGVELAGEAVLKVIIPAADIIPAESLAALVANYRELLWVVLLAIGIAYIPWAMLAGAAAVAVYKQIRTAKVD